MSQDEIHKTQNAGMGHEMQIKEIMTSGVECISPNATIAEAAERMKSLDVGAVPVCGENDELVGMITDRDIAIRCVAAQGDPTSTTVNDIMTPDILFCREDQDLAEAAEMMERQQVRRLVVINDEKRLVGIASLGDLAVKTNDESLCSEVLEAVST